MSHTDSCPSDWEARREGERAFDRGRSRSSNPYDDQYAYRGYGDPPYCEDAARAFDRGYNAARQQREDEEYEARRAEEAARQRAEDEYYERIRYERQQEEQYYQELAEQEAAEMEAEAQAAEEAAAKAAEAEAAAQQIHPSPSGGSDE